MQLAHVVRFSRETGIPVVTTLHDAQRKSGNVHSTSSGHGRSVDLIEPEPVNIRFDLFEPDRVIFFSLKFPTAGHTARASTS